MSMTVAEYLLSPVSERYRYGFWYIRPFALEWNEWDLFDRMIAAQHPIQYRLREWSSEVAGFFARAWRSVRCGYRWLFHPCHPSVRAAVRRDWQDLDSVMEDVCFAIIREFRQEMIDGWVDWSATERHREFEAWIIDAVDYLDRRRPDLQKSVGDLEMPECGLGVILGGDSDAKAAFRKWSEAHTRIESEIEALDTKYLTEMIQKRGFFWT